jgi:hypothetical protein
MHAAAAAAEFFSKSETCQFLFSWIVASSVPPKYSTVTDLTILMRTEREGGREGRQQQLGRKEIIWLGSECNLKRGRSSFSYHVTIQIAGRKIAQGEI